MRSIPKMERDGYIICANPDSILSAKIVPQPYRIGSGERALFFGECQVYGNLVCEGQLDVQPGTSYLYNINDLSITSDLTAYGIVQINNELSLNATLTIL